MKALLIGAIFLPTVAFAHGSAHWIQSNPNFLTSLLNPDQVGIHCCGPSDCTPWPEEDVSVQPDGYHIKSTGEIIPYAKTYYTDADQVKVSRYWRCIFTSNVSGSVEHKAGQTRCFFSPGGAS